MFELTIEYVKHRGEFTIEVSMEDSDEVIITEHFKNIGDSTILARTIISNPEASLGYETFVRNMGGRENVFLGFIKGYRLVTCGNESILDHRLDLEWLYQSEDFAATMKLGQYMSFVGQCLEPTVVCNGELTEKCGFTFSANSSTMTSYSIDLITDIPLCDMYDPRCP